MKKKTKKRRYFWFIFPGFIVYSLFAIYPILNAIPNSFMKWGGIGEKKWIGLDNYINLFTHPQLAPAFFNAAENTMVFLIMNLIITNTLSVLIAYAFFRKIPFHKQYQTIIFSPHFLYATAIGFVYTLMFDPTIGLFAKFMTAIGLSKYSTFPWLSDPNMGIVMVWIINSWKGIGYTTLLYLAGFTMVSKDYEEAAKIDGATSLHLFTRIYFPMIRTTFINTILLTYIWDITIFDIPYVIGGSSGGLGQGMDTLETFFYRITFSASSGFANNYVGIGSAISVCVFAAILIGVLIFMAIVKRKAQD